MRKPHARVLHQGPAARSLGRSVLALGLAVLANVVQAQPVELKGMMELALTRHPTILQSRSQAQAAGFELDAAKWGRFPTFSSEVRSDSTYTQSLAKVEQPLWAGGRIDARIALGQSNQQAAEAAVRDAQLTALTQVASAYLEAVRLQVRLKLADDNVREHERLRDMIARRIKSEVSPSADGTLAQARLQQALTEQLQIQRQLDTNRNQLIQWAGPIPASLPAPRSIAYKPPASAPAAFDMARETSAQRRKLQAQIESALAQIDVAKSQTLPTVVAGVQYVLQGPLGANADRSRAYVGLQYQPGAGLSAQSGVQGALARKEAAEQELQVLDRNLENQIGNLHSEIDILNNQLRPARQLTTDTVELVDSYLRQYQVGRKNWLDVLNALREKTQALYNLTDVQYSLMLAQVRMMLVTGQLDGQNLATLHD